MVRAHPEAFSSGDLTATLATMAPDAVFISGTTLVAPQDFEEFFGWAIREIDPAMNVTGVVVDGRHVACEFVESMTMAGQRQHLNRAAFYTVDDGLITSAKVNDERD